ncbi:hypothetical protein ACFLT2_10385 [Acidobacteriota bacterium]
MNVFTLIKNLITKIFSRKKYQYQDLRQHISLEEEDTKRKDPYFVQIGFDFGTSYSKCIWRDMMANKAFVYLCSMSEEYELPFLIPSALVIKDGILSMAENPRVQYPENGLYHLKNALVSVALEQWDDPVLIPFRSALEHYENRQLNEFVESCAVYFLSCAICDIRKHLREKMPDFGMLPTDYMAINMAVPVADAERPAVNSLYQKVLYDAWGLTDRFVGYPKIQISEVDAMRREIKDHEDRSGDGACYIYPEVSANVQGFIRSRVSSPGIYLFSDTGGGSVDQSVFIFIRDAERGDLLTYLTGNVHSVGSSHIERIAAECVNDSSCDSLESWREKKENGESDKELSIARNEIAEKLEQCTESTLASAKKKLINKDQLTKVRLIFAGGGHCDFPYKYGTQRPFSGGQFPRSIDPDVIGLPIPSDLELSDLGNRWMSRLYVAYGLSFEQNDLAKFIYPKDVRSPEPEEIWQPHKMPLDFQGKEVT